MQRDREITIEEKTKKKGVKRVGGETPVSASAEPELGFQKFLVRGWRVGFLERIFFFYHARLYL